MMRRLTYRLLLACMLIVVPHTTIGAESKPLHIAILVWRGETKAEQGFKDALQSSDYDVTYTVLNARQDQKRLARLLKTEVLPRINTFDYIYTFGTTVSKMTRGVIRNQVPQIFNVVTDPVGAGIVNSLQTPGGNISGATDRIPLAMQLEAGLKILPFRRLGLLFNPREKNAMIERQRLYEVAEQLQLEVVDLRSPPVHGILQKNLQKLRDKTIIVDAVYLPPDSYMVSQAELIGRQLHAANIPSFGSVKAFIEHGALVGVVADYAQLGRAVAQIVHRHQHGEQLGQISVQTVQTPWLVINKTSSERFKLSIPEDVLKKAVIVE